MDYSKISKEGVDLLKIVIDNDAKKISTDPVIVENLLSKFIIISEATEKVLLQNERENKAFEELLKRASLLIIHLENEQVKLSEIIKSSKGSIEVNETTRKKAQEELKEIKLRITKSQQEIEKLKPKIEFQWWWIFCWWCGLAAAGIENAINAKIAEIEKLQLKADLLDSRIVNDNIGEYNKTIIKLEKKLKTDHAVLTTLKRNQEDLVIKAKLFAGKTASSSHLNDEIEIIVKNLKKLYDKRERVYLLPSRLNTVLDFCDGKTHKSLPMIKILSIWGEVLNAVLTPTGASVQAVRLAIEGKEFGHFRKVTGSNWEFVGTSKFDSYKNLPVVKILVNGQFKETGRDQWSIFLENNTQKVWIDIWTKIFTVTNKNTKEVFTTEIIDGSLAEEVLFYGKDGISQEAVAKLCLEKNWQLASEFEVSIAWIHKGLSVFAFGQLRNNLLAVPIQSDMGAFKKGLNIIPFGSKNSGNQGFFYIDNKILTFRELKPAK